MTVDVYTNYETIKKDGLATPVSSFLSAQPTGNFFQTLGFFQLCEQSRGFKPLLLIARNEGQEITGALVGTYLSNGRGVKSWMSRRLIIWGGPIVSQHDGSLAADAARRLLTSLSAHARKRAIYIEFRNLFDTSALKKAFEDCGFEYQQHLNILVPTDNLEAVKKRMSNSRFRQIRSSLKAGASISEPASEKEVADFYEILRSLYRKKVKKPIPDIGLFRNFWKYGAGKIFLIKLENQVIGGIVCPAFEDKVIYEWYVCGKDDVGKKVYPSVLATWAPIDYGLNNGFKYFDFMGAGRPDEPYGVREFKSRFGGREVSFGRYQMIVNKSLYAIAKFGLKAYQRVLPAVT